MGPKPGSSSSPMHNFYHRFNHAIFYMHGNDLIADIEILNMHNVSAAPRETSMLDMLNVKNERQPSFKRFFFSANRLKVSEKKDILMRIFFLNSTSL